MRPFFFFCVRDYVFEISRFMEDTWKRRVYRKCWILRKKCVKENNSLCSHAANVYNDTKDLLEAAVMPTAENHYYNGKEEFISWIS